MVGSLVRFLFTCCEESQTHSFAALTRSFAILHNSWIKIVRTHQPWSNLYFLNRQLPVTTSISLQSASWLDRTVCDADILIPGYTTFRQDRGPHKRGGGVLVYVKDIYKGCVIEKWSSVSESNFQQLQLKVQCKKFKSFLLCTVYRPPDAPIDF